ncbi:hypothetical protein EPO15_10135 [bacterium]|nr:MAG: hypothetical protein EPO15_10135 [bacterium]
MPRDCHKPPPPPSIWPVSRFLYHRASPMPERPRLVRFLVNTLWSLWGLVVLSALSFFLLPLMVRGLGLEGYALYALMGSFSGYLLLLTMGAGNATVKFVAELRGKGDGNAVRAAVLASLRLHTLPVLAGSAALFAARGWLTASFLNVSPAAQADAAFLVAAASASGVFVALLQLAVCVNQGLQRFPAANALLVAQSTLVLGGSALLVWLGHGLRSLGVLYIAVHVALAVGALAWAWASLPDAAPEDGAADRATAASFRSYALQIFVTQLAWSATFQWDRLVLGSRLPLAELAYYTIPAMLLQKLFALPNAAMVSLFPMISEMEGQGEADALGRVYRLGGQLVLWLTVPGFLLLSLFAPQLLSLWLGGDFSEKGVWPLRLIAAGYFFNLLGSMPTTAATGRGRPAYTSAWQTAQAALCLVGWVVFIPRMGILGAALAFALAQALAALPYVWLVSRDLFGMTAAEYAGEVLARPLAAAAGLLAVLWPLRERATGWGSLAALCALGTLAYCGAGLAVVGSDERALIRRLWGATLGRAEPAS